MSSRVAWLQSNFIASLSNLVRMCLKAKGQGLYSLMVEFA